MIPIAMLSGCLIDRDVYESRLDLMTDSDGDGFSELQGDCDDQNYLLHPEVKEVCDEIDNDCDGLIDEDAGSSWFFDNEGDGFWG